MTCQPCHQKNRKTYKVNQTLSPEILAASGLTADQIVCYDISHPDYVCDVDVEEQTLNTQQQNQPFIQISEGKNRRRRHRKNKDICFEKRN